MPFRLVPPLREVLLRTRFVPCGSCLAACAVPGGQGRSRTTVSCVAGRGLSQVLWRAWISVQRNRGAPGIDQITLGHVEEYGVTRLLGELASELQAGTWRPLPARKVLIPKPGSSERRPLAIATRASYCFPFQALCGLGFDVGGELV